MKYLKLFKANLTNFNALLGSLLLLSTSAFAENLDSPLVDEAQMFSSAESVQLIDQLENLKQEKDIWMVVWTTPSLQGHAIEELANSNFNRWQIGQKGKNNGLLLTIAKKEHQMRLEVGYGLEPVLTDAKTKRLQDEILRPALRNGTNAEGVLKLISEINKLDPELPEARKLFSYPLTDVFRALIFILIGLFTLPILSRVLRNAFLPGFRLAAILEDDRRRDEFQKSVLASLSKVRWITIPLPIALGLCGLFLDEVPWYFMIVFGTFAFSLLFAAINGFTDAYVNRLERSWFTLLESLATNPSEHTRLKELREMLAIEAYERRQRARRAQNFSQNYPNDFSNLGDSSGGGSSDSGSSSPSDGGSSGGGGSNSSW